MICFMALDPINNTSWKKTSAQSHPKEGWTEGWMIGGEQTHNYDRWYTRELDYYIMAVHLLVLSIFNLQGMREVVLSNDPVLLI